MASSTFSAVIAGEFNAGKSTFINALLGGTILRSGPLPTTDQIHLISIAPLPNPHTSTPPTLLSQSSSPTSVDFASYEVSHAFGHETNELLKDLQLIDTPGTNAIDELGHEALTRRLLPEADVIIFVTSAEQAISESERKLLQVIKTWQKPVIVVINKRDALMNPSDEEQVTAFVEQRVQQIFEQPMPTILVSSKKALAAKEAASIPPISSLSSLPEYVSSNFSALESLLETQLSSENKVQAKILSPLGLTDSLLSEVDEAIEKKHRALGDDLTTLKLLRKQNELWESTLPNNTSNLAKDLDTVLQQLGEDVDHKIGELSLAELLETSTDPKLKLSPDASLIEQRLSKVTSKHTISLADSGRAQSAAVVEFLHSRPLHLPHSLISSTNLNAVNISTDAMSRRINVDPQELNLGELEASVSKATARALNVSKLGMGASALGAAGSLASFTSLAAVDPYLGVALGGFAFVTGAVASVRSVTLIRSSFLTTYARFSSRLQKEILANFDSEVETLKTNLDSQCTPFAKYVEAEMATCRSRKKESEELKQRSRALRFEVEDSSSTFIGGFRSDGR